MCIVCGKDKCRGLSFDGFGINDCSKHRLRIATMNRLYSHDTLDRCGKLFALAPKLLSALRSITKIRSDRYGVRQVTQDHMVEIHKLLSQLGD